MTLFKEIRLLYGIEGNENFGYTETEITDFETTHDLKLPKVLRDYYLTLGKHQAINNSFNRLLKPKGQVGFSDDRYLIFYEENQAVVFWGIKEADLTAGNPKVFGNYDPVNQTEDWFEDSADTEKFLLSMALLNGTLGGLKYNANKINEEELKPGILELIEEGWTEIKDLILSPQRYFTRDFREIIILSINTENKPSGIFIGTNDEERYHNIIDRLPIDWDYFSDEDDDE